MISIPVSRKIPGLAGLKELYYASVPRNEQIPFFMLLRMAKRDNVDFVAYFVETECIGFTYTLTSNDLAYVLYFAVDPKQQSKGYGSKILDMIIKKYKHPVMVSIEDPTIDADNTKQRVKRLSFYLRNGFKTLSWDQIANVERLKNLATVPTVQSETFDRLMREYLGTIIYTLFRPEYIYHAQDEVDTH